MTNIRYAQDDIRLLLRVDGRVLNFLTVDDLFMLKVTNQLHHLSIKHGIKVGEALLHILREKLAFFGVNFILQKFGSCKKMTNIRYAHLHASLHGINI